MSIPYLDPAISYSERQSRLKDTYGFDCSCKLCTLQSSMVIRPVDPPQVLSLVSPLEVALHRFAFGEGITADFQLPEEQLCGKLPGNFQPLMDASVLAFLTTRFSIASDEGHIEVAMTTGTTILAIYLCIYPPYYPQIGSRTSYTSSSTDSSTQVFMSSRWRRSHGTSTRHGSSANISKRRRSTLRSRSGYSMCTGEKGIAAGRWRRRIPCWG